MPMIPSCLEKGAGPAILFLHGVGGDGASFGHQLDHFANAGFRALAWHMPGYGSSERLPEYSFPKLAEAAFRLLDALQLARCHVVGHSIGGMVAQEMAVADSARLQTLTLSATSPAFGNPDGEFQRRFLADRLEPLDRGSTMEQVAAAVMPSLLGPGADPAVVRAAISIMSRVPAEAYRDAMKCIVTFDRRSELERLRLPTLVICGENDTNAPPRVMRRIADRVAGSQFTILAGAGHLAYLEQPSAFNRIVAEFIKEPR